MVEVLTGVRSWRAFFYLFFNSGGLLVFNLVLIRCVFVRKVGPVEQSSVLIVN